MSLAVRPPLWSTTLRLPFLPAVMSLMVGKPCTPNSAARKQQRTGCSLTQLLAVRGTGEFDAQARLLWVSASTAATLTMPFKAEAACNGRQGVHQAWAGQKSLLECQGAAYADLLPGGSQSLTVSTPAKAAGCWLQYIVDATRPDHSSHSRIYSSRSSAKRARAMVRKTLQATRHRLV